VIEDRLASFVVAQEGEDLSVFRNEREATRLIEREDALSGPMTFAAGDGTTLRPVADNGAEYGWRLERRNDEIFDLRAPLIEYLGGIDSLKISVSALDLAELLELVASLQTTTNP
jgi:hypothetical protein